MGGPPHGLKMFVYGGPSEAVAPCNGRLGFVFGACDDRSQNLSGEPKARVLGLGQKVEDPEDRIGEEGGLGFVGFLGWRVFQGIELVVIQVARYGGVIDERAINARRFHLRLLLFAHDGPGDLVFPIAFALALGVAHSMPAKTESRAFRFLRESGAGGAATTPPRTFSISAGTENLARALSRVAL